MRDPSACGRATAVHISNLGVLDSGDDGALIESLRFAVPQHALGAMLWLSAGTLAGCLHGTLLSVAPLITEATSQHFAPALRKAMLDHAQGPR